MGKVHSVSEVTQLIKNTLAAVPLLQRIQVRGELSNFKRYESGHCYFTLKDEKGILKSVMFRGRAGLLRFKPENGMVVMAAGRIEVYERDGVYQMYVDNLFLDGAGDLMLAYEELKQRLQKEGLFAEARKRALPFLPETVGIITSASGAVLHDIITVAKKRNPSVRLLFLPVRVQGKEAPGEIVAAIAMMNKVAQADVLIVGRGGGSLEELRAFNDEKVVRAVAGSAIPVISAVGHETDFSLCDFAADVRAATPSQAAEIAIPEREALLAAIASKRERLDQLLRFKLDSLIMRLKHCSNARTFQRPEVLFEHHLQRLDRLGEQVKSAMKQRVLLEEKRLSAFSGRLQALSPLAVLARGYSVTTDKDDYVIKGTVDLMPGDIVKTRLAEGLIYSRVESLDYEGEGYGQEKSRK